MDNKPLFNVDPEIALLIEQEEERIENSIDLIASENYTSQAVMEATGSVMTNKYAEGYPKARYYAGCTFVDAAEELAQKRLLELFKLSPADFHANVQPHAGAPANMCVLFSLLKPSDTLLGMDLSAGGHLTHGYKINFSGQLYNAVHYGVSKETGYIDYQEVKELALKHQPKLIIAGASAYSRILDFKKFREIADLVGAKLLVDMAHIAGLIAAGVHPSPFPYADFVTSTTHKTLRGPRGGIIICKKEYGKLIDKTIIPGFQGGPLMHHIAAKAVAFKEALEPSFTSYQQQIVKNSQAMVKVFKEYGYDIVSGGTDNHLFIIDLRSKHLTGLEVENLLIQVNICVNKNCIPYDPEKPFITSGIRIGTPAITTRGCKEEDAETIAHLIHEAITHKSDINALVHIKNKVLNFCKNFPVYREKKYTIPEFIPAYKEKNNNI